MIRTLKEFAHESARRYLQSAVFVDDQIFDKRSEVLVEQSDLPRPRKPVFRAESKERTTTTDDQIGEREGDEIERPYHPKELVSSFAKEGIICALYEPPEGFSTSPDSEIFKLCERADIIILDWDFSNDRGEKALELIAGMVKQSHEESPHHARLLSIYTIDPSLVAVADRLDEHLRGKGFDPQPEGSPCRLRSSAMLLVVLGKDKTRFGKDEEQFTVKASDLAKRLIEEFEAMNAGILPSYALHGLAAIRRNSKRILDRFHRGMDGAFLLHRKLVATSEEAFDQLPELLADELRAVVEDAQLAPDDVERIAASALEDGDISAPDKESIASNTKPDRVVKQLAGDQRSVPLGHKHLAALFNNRTQYSQASRVLGYGTIIRSRPQAQDQWTYSICLMPVCDSLRLDPEKKTRFPFWRLEQDAYTSKSRRRGMVLYLPDGIPIELTASGKATDKLWTEEFTADTATRTVKAVLTDGSFIFANSRFEIEWVGQLKQLHTQRIAHDIGQSLSRVGLVEAEWLRLLCEH